MKLKSKKISREKITRILIITLALAIIIYLISSAYLFLPIEYKRKPILKEKFEKNDVNYLYNFYVTNKPSISDRPYYGDSNASITIIVYSNFNCEQCRNFIFNLFPQIQAELINTGKARFYHKNYLSSEDYAQKNENFIYANSQLCFYAINQDKYWDFYFELYNTSVEKIPGLAAKYGVQKDQFNNCTQNRSFTQIQEDLSEVINFGLNGISPVIYVGINGRDNTIFYGVPSITRFQRVVLDKEITLGI